MLIDTPWHHVVMFALLLILIVPLVAFLVYAMGADSRVDDVGRRRGLQR